MSVSLPDHIVMAGAMMIGHRSHAFHQAKHEGARSIAVEPGLLWISSAVFSNAQSC